MNFFFSIKFKSIKSKLKIPLFTNEKLLPTCSNVYSAEVKNNKYWKIKKLNNNNKKFLILEKDLDNHKIFFISNDKEIILKKKLLKKKLINLNSLTDTVPSFRSNLMIYYKNSGFTSYQSEYPFEMTTKNGSIISPINTLLNKNADENFLAFRNIHYLPKIEQYNLFFLDIKKKKIVMTKKIYSNTTNIIPIEKKFIENKYYILSEKILGIPIYISIHNGHLSMEHTHPPHLYLWDKNKFEVIKKFKKKFHYEISNN
jgi:hypothetical protein